MRLKRPLEKERHRHRGCACHPEGQGAHDREPGHYLPRSFQPERWPSFERFVASSGNPRAMKHDAGSKEFFREVEQSLKRHKAVLIGWRGGLEIQRAYGERVALFGQRHHRAMTAREHRKIAAAEGLAVVDGVARIPDGQLVVKVGHEVKVLGIEFASGSYSLKQVSQKIAAGMGVKVEHGGRAVRGATAGGYSYYVQSRGKMAKVQDGPDLVGHLIGM